MAKRKILLPVVLLIFFILLFFSLSNDQQSVQQIPKFVVGKVKKVIDGDTFLLENGEKVRLIGVDTPELHHPTKPVQYFAEEARNFTGKLVEGKKVRLEFDWQERDKYGRLLAYVYLLEGNLFLNAEIIKQGYGFAYTKYPFKYLEEFKEYEREARSKAVGLWKGGGKAEFQWLVAENRKPFKVYDMANSLWAIEYDGFIKTRIDDEEFLNTLNEARPLIYELNEDDLKEQLLKQGWEER